MDEVAWKNGLNNINIYFLDIFRKHMLNDLKTLKSQKINSINFNELIYILS